jgi:phosphatidylserine decarboxylase
LLWLAGLAGFWASPGLVTGILLVVATLVWGSLLFFFRDPERSSPADERLVLSPADGQVLSVDDVDEPDFLQGRAHRISIFLSVLDVHVNRSPVTGRVEFVRHRSGAFHQAFRPEASERNEHNLVGIVSQGDRILLRQIAGVLARRVVCRVRPGDHLTSGERFGLIKFGSRVEVYLPLHHTVVVRPDDRVAAGMTVLATRAQRSDLGGPLSYGERNE